MPERISSKPHAGGKTDRPASVFLDTRGNPSLGIGICQRCQFKFPLHMLQDDPNIPNFKVCAADRDDFDPYRMPARPADKITLPYVRPDEPLTPGPAGIVVGPEPTEEFRITQDGSGRITETNGFRIIQESPTPGGDRITQSGDVRVTQSGDTRVTQ